MLGGKSSQLWEQVINMPNPNVTASITPTSMKGQSILHIHSPTDRKDYPLVSLQFPTDIAEYIVELINLDQSRRNKAQEIK